MQLLPSKIIVRDAAHVETSRDLERQLRELDACFDRLQRVMMSRLAPPLTDVELSPQDGRALVTRSGRGPITMTDFSELLGVPLSTATRTVERLIEKGLAIRSRIEDDRRVVRVDLSEEGKKLNQKFAEHRRAFGNAMLSPLTHGEREIFIELMSKMTRPQSTE
jgi:DNA-binding MarR family transcriptional regulator